MGHLNFDVPVGRDVEVPDSVKPHSSRVVTEDDLGEPLVLNTERLDELALRDPPLLAVRGATIVILQS